MIKLFINKIGFEHVEYGINCHDFGLDNSKIKCVVDGCSEGKHSEVGAKLFCNLLDKVETPIQIKDIDNTFEILTSIIGTAPSEIRDYMCFTILYIVEDEEEFKVYVCGDGYIIKQTIDNEIEYQEIDNGKYPIYYSYNYTPKESLGLYKDGVIFQEFKFSKQEYSSIGVTTDGIRYIFGAEFEEEFTKLILNRKINAIKRLINREHKHFKDDITIVI